MRRTILFVAFGALLAANPGCHKDRRQAPVAAAPSLERALEALDSGDLVGAEQILVRRLGSKRSDKALLDAIRQSKTSDGQFSPLLDNVRAKVVPRPTFPPAVNRGSIVCPLCPRLLARSKVEPKPMLDVLSALGDPLYVTRGARSIAERMSGKSEIPAELLRRLPLTYGGERLVMALPQSDDRWLLLYGKDMGRARFVVLLDPGPAVDPERRVTAFDFKNFIEPPETFAPDETHEMITWAALDGDRLFVANTHSNNPNASHGMSAYLTAIDVKSNAVIWRSAGEVASGGSFVITDQYVICGYDDYEYMRLFTLDRQTGRTVGVLALPIPAWALWVEGGKLMALGGDYQLTFSEVPGLRNSPIGQRRLAARDALAKLVLPARMRAFALEPDAARKRATAIAALDDRRPLDAYRTLKALVESEGLAGNYSVQALLEAAAKNVATARADSVATVQKRATNLNVGRASGVRPAKVEQGPMLRLTKLFEARDLPLRDPTIFEERRIASAEIDRPYPGHVGDLPDYVPAKLGTQLLFSARYAAAGKTLVAVYAGATVLFDTERRGPESRLDFVALGAPTEWPQVHRLEVAGEVVIAAGHATSAWFTAFNRRTAEAYWTTALAVDDMLVIDGWIVASTPSQKPVGKYDSDIVVVDATTGEVTSRIHTVPLSGIARQGDEIIGGASSSRVVLAITRE
jgi:hypothetical protein